MTSPQITASAGPGPEAIQPPSLAAEEASEPPRRSSPGARHDDPSLSGAMWGASVMELGLWGMPQCRKAAINGLYHPFMVIGAVYDCFNHITGLIGP